MYPDSVNPGDPNAPWNQEDAEEQTFYVTIEVKVGAAYHSEAVEKVTDKLASLPESDVDLISVFSESEV